MKWNNELLLNRICVDILTLLNISKGECLRLHNNRRDLHQNTLPLFYDDKIEVDAQRWADHLAATGAFEHESNIPYGENLYSSYRSPPISDNVEIIMATSDWYDIS